MTRERLTQDIINVCQRLYSKNMLASADGNVSTLLEANQYLITPSGVSKAYMDDQNMAVVNLDGEVIDGNPSSERLMHMQVYRSCSKAKAVVHAHPPHAIAWSVASPEMKELPAECLSEVILATGGIPIVPYARPSTQSMGENLKPFLPKHRVMILARHGALSWGESLEEAYRGMERLEHSAYILYLAKTLGGLTRLPDSEVEALQKMRSNMGDQIL